MPGCVCPFLVFLSGFNDILFHFKKKSIYIYIYTLYFDCLISSKRSPKIKIDNYLHRSELDFTLKKKKIHGLVTYIEKN